MAKARPNSNSVLNTYSPLSVNQMDEDDDGQLTPLYHPNLQAEASGSFFSRVKQSFTGSSFGNILGQNNPPAMRSNALDTRNSQNSLQDHEMHSCHSDSPALTPRRLPSIKHVFTPIPDYSPSRSRSHTSGSPHSDASTDSSSPSLFASPLSSSCFSPISFSSQPTYATSAHDSDNDKWSPVLTSPSEAQDTPPLTPATSNDDTTFYQSPKGVCTQTRSQRSASISFRDEEDTSESSEGKKGKKPAPPFPYDTLIADISGPSVPDTEETTEDVAIEDGHGEWWGLEYTLELSRRDSRASDTSSSTTGEHSKSHESWAAIHQGILPPVYEDANFQDWQKWHRALDKIELRRRRKRTIDFIEESDRLASLYVDEILAQRAVQIHEDLLSDDEIYDALVWVEYAAERRPDPFSPPEKHNLGWVLKSHRSVACLRELQELPLEDD